MSVKVVTVGKLGSLGNSSYSGDEEVLRILSKVPDEEFCTRPATDK